MGLDMQRGERRMPTELLETGEETHAGSNPAERNGLRAGKLVAKWQTRRHMLRPFCRCSFPNIAARADTRQPEPVLGNRPSLRSAIRSELMLGNPVRAHARQSSDSREIPLEIQYANENAAHRRFQR